MRILLLSPFHGHSSHAHWAQRLQAHSRHEIQLQTLEDKAWSWRLKGSSLPMARACLEKTGDFDILMATSLLDLSVFQGILRRSPLSQIPAVYYMHENQLTYPIRPGGKRDSQLILRQFHSQVVADEIWFNSRFHLQSWFAALPKFLSRFPDHQGLAEVEELRAKSQVMPVGIDRPSPRAQLQRSKPLLLWNQRWEWEKGTDRFVSLLEKFDDQVSFELALMGGRFRDTDPLVKRLRDRLGERIVHQGWCALEDYQGWMQEASVLVSAARHDFFGISVLEAQSQGLMTFLPDALAYPEILPNELHSACLYKSQKDLYRRLRQYFEEPDAYLETRRALQKASEAYHWDKVGELYDQGFERVEILA